MKIEIFDKYAGETVKASEKQIKKHGGVDNYLIAKYKDRERKSGARAGSQKPLPARGARQLQSDIKAQTAARRGTSANLIDKANRRMRELEKRGTSTPAYERAVARLEIAHAAEIDRGMYALPRFRKGDEAAAAAFLNTPSSTISGIRRELKAAGALGIANMTDAEIVSYYSMLYEIAEREQSELKYLTEHDAVDIALGQGKGRKSTPRTDDRRYSEKRRRVDERIDLRRIRNAER